MDILYALFKVSINDITMVYDVLQPSTRLVPCLDFTTRLLTSILKPSAEYGPLLLSSLNISPQDTEADAHLHTHPGQVLRLLTRPANSTLQSTQQK